MHDIFLLCTIFVHPSYFMKLTKISKCVNILFPLLGIPKKAIFFLLIKYSLCPHHGAHADRHWRQHRIEGHIKPQNREQSCPWCYFWVNLMGAIPGPNSTKVEKRFWTLAAHVNHLGSSLRDASLFVLRGDHTQLCSWALQVLRNQVRVEFHTVGEYAMLVEMCTEYLHPRNSQQLLWARIYFKSPRGDTELLDHICLYLFIASQLQFNINLLQFNIFCVWEW